MAFVNVGVKDRNSADIPTKAALKRMVAEDPSLLGLYSTAAFGPQFRSWLPEMDKSNKYSVTGPNPYNKRDWYATIEYSTKTDKWVVK